MRAGYLPLLVLLAAVLSSVTRAQAQNGPASTETAEEKLEKEFTNPLTTLPQVLLRDTYSPANYGTEVETNQVIIRPLIPRVPPRSYLPFAQLIRPTFSLVTVPSVRGGVRTEFGDLAVFDLAVLPWIDRKKTGLVMGVGPAFVFPTATSRSAGDGAWQGGPAFGAIYDGIPGVLLGFVAQNPISFAYTSPKREPQSAFQLQPVIAIHLWDKWYLRSAEANWSIGWRRHSSTTLPLSLGIGRTFVRAGMPPMSFFVTGQWMMYRQYAPIAPQTSVNFGLTMAFPQYRNYWGR